MNRFGDALTFSTRCRLARQPIVSFERCLHLSAGTLAMRWPIRNQILVPLLAVAIVSLTAVGAINTVLTERRTCAYVEQQLRQVIGVLTTSSFPLTDTVLRQMRELSNAD